MMIWRLPSKHSVSLLVAFLLGSTLSFLVIWVVYFYSKLVIYYRSYHFSASALEQNIFQKLFCTVVEKKISLISNSILRKSVKIGQNRKFEYLNAIWPEKFFLHFLISTTVKCMFIMSSSTEYPMRKKNIQKCENNEKMPFAASAPKKVP